MASSPACSTATCWGTKRWAKWSKSVPGTANSGSATALSCRSPSRAANASSANVAISRAASAPIPMRRRRRSCGDIRPRGCSATRTCWAAIPAARRNICGSRSPMSGRSRSPTGSATSRCCSCQTFSRPATWARSSATSKAARRLPCSDVARWRNLPFAAPSCWAPNG